ncbi:hypothetical protein K443DRAFT_258918 [Laccaria amethystina LaAM-08-1]|uniref:Uncharacterized protein n=1 Tax=Laccaria amethystina LaAM-08-1 TaxID=1095629 RepID=A0A0C9WLB5_9AGAR|nr:hypothetical protein K443DRAFT_258918 [Laccaria amethystina LaAM-08-1]
MTLAFYHSFRITVIIAFRIAPSSGPSNISLSLYLRLLFNAHSSNADIQRSFPRVLLKRLCLRIHCYVPPVNNSRPPTC